MARTYYSNDYWSKPLPQRLQAATLRLEQARAQLRRSKERLNAPPRELRVHEERPAYQSPYAPTDPYMRSLWEKARAAEPPERPDVFEFVIRVPRDQELLRRHYLIDLASYLEAFAEYERLKREQEQAQDAGPRTPQPQEPRTIPMTPPRPGAPAPDRKEQEMHRRLAKMREEAAEELRKAIRKLRKNRDRNSVVEVMEGEARLQFTLEEPDHPLLQEARILVAEVVPEIEDKKKDGFRKMPNAQNYRVWTDSRADSQNLGVDRPERDPLADVKRLRADKRYTTVAGDTLSGIASKFYGRADLWYVIYELNRGATEDNPDKLLPGLTLEIP
jgi:nucleoid-associated protein YgaU